MTIMLGRCRWCGKPLEQALRGRDKVYCTSDCRVKWTEEEKRDG